MRSVQAKGCLHRRLRHTKLTFFSVGFEEDRTAVGLHEKNCEGEGSILNALQSGASGPNPFTSFERGMKWQEK